MQTLYEAPKTIHHAISKEMPHFVDQLKKLVSFPGVSAQGFEQPPLVETADWLLEQCKNLGLTDIKKVKLPGAAPYVLAKMASDKPNAPTILVYAHYDVQPTGDAKLWQTEPFVATEKEGRLYGRGTADDKAGVMGPLAAIQAFQKADTAIPANITLLFEGEEECGSPHIRKLLQQEKKYLKADYLIVPDLVNPGINQPSITFSLRGLVEFQVDISGMKKALHSGLGGGVVPDPTAALANIYGNALGKNAEVTIPGIRRPTMPASVKKMLSKIPFEPNKLKKEFNLPKNATLLQKSKKSYYEALWFHPALTLVHTQIAEKNNYANRIQTDVEAVFSFRLGAQQSPKSIIPKLKKFFEKNTYGCDLKFTLHHEAQGFYTDPHQQYFQNALQCMSKAYGKRAIALGAGLSIPFVHEINNTLGPLKTILLGIEDPQTQAHAENESMHLPMFEKTIRTLANFFYCLQ